MRKLLERQDSIVTGLENDLELAQEQLTTEIESHHTTQNDIVDLTTAIKKLESDTQQLTDDNKQLQGENNQYQNHFLASSHVRDY